MHRLASTLASRPRVSVHTASGRNGLEIRTALRLIARLPGWSIGRRRSCGMLGGHRPAARAQSRSDHQGCRRQALQQRAHGGPTSALQRRLRILAAEFEKGARSFDPGGALKIGATLVRQWRGQTHTVLVREDGFEYEGQCYRSLTVIAERITGAHWLGPRFFGVSKQARAF